MMFSRSNTTADDQRLVDYLLGALPEDETERFDERSITDDEFAGRLDAVENELVDAYVRGELPRTKLAQFQSAYLSSPERREKVRFAEALRSRSAPAIRRWSIGAVRRWQWAAAAAVLVAVSGYLLYQNGRLRQELARQTAPRPAQEQPERPSVPESSQGARPKLNIAAFVLAAQTRDANSVTTIAVPAGTDRVLLHLQLESDDFPVYRAALRDPATNRLIWRAAGLTAQTTPAGRVLSIDVPRALLKSQHYTVELTGLSSAGASAFAGSYAFREVE